MSRRNAQKDALANGITCAMQPEPMTSWSSTSRCAHSAPSDSSSITAVCFHACGVVASWS